MEFPDTIELTRQVKDLEGKIRFQDDLIAGWQNTTRLLQDKVAELEAITEGGMVHSARLDAAESIIQKFLGAGLGGSIDLLLHGHAHLEAQRYFQKLEPEPECETCGGEGTFDGRIGGEWTSNPKTPCPDCEGRHA